MTEYEVDVGNTYIKWRKRVSGKYLPSTRGGVEMLAKELSDCPADLVLVSCVAGEEIRRALNNLFAELEVPTAYWAESSQEACGVLNGYKEYTKLGVDRWLACLAGFNKSGGSACCIIDFGSAITVDILDGEGRHLGGYIAPGSRLCFEALGATGSLAGQYEYVSGGTLGLSTKSCIESGVYMMQLGFLTQVLEVVSGLKCFVTGGGSAQFSSVLDENSVEIFTDLVLDGLRLAYEDDVAVMGRGE
ncbi:type III pantothenate kinase [Hahella ganghwensis]|uniref:type III pantothenate kinase n=1 Tax=Hahella ganghwensis TaxID=286420 RepID=UPI000362FCC5|nr:type III pantothenate kinase [Hahella ganghwensis]